MKTLVLILFFAICSHAHSKGFQIATCSLIDNVEIDGQEVSYLTIGAASHGESDSINGAAVSFYGWGMKLIWSSNDFDGEALYSGTVDRYTEVTLKEDMNKRPLKFRATRYKIISHLEKFETGYKGVEADCEFN